MCYLGEEEQEDIEASQGILKEKRRTHQGLTLEKEQQEDRVIDGLPGVTDTLWSGPSPSLTSTNAGVRGEGIIGDFGKTEPGGPEGLLASLFSGSNRKAEGAPHPTKQVPLGPVPQLPNKENVSLITNSHARMKELAGSTVLLWDGSSSERAPSQPFSSRFF